MTIALVDESKFFVVSYSAVFQGDKLLRVEEAKNLGPLRQEWRIAKNEPVNAST
jgi:hypothetical protein